MPIVAGASRRALTGPRVIDAVLYGVVADNRSRVTKNTVALQRAADAVAAAGGGTLRLPAGEITYGGPHAGAALYVSSNTRIEGAGPFATTLRNATDSAFIASVDTENIEIVDVGFNGTSTGHVPWQTGIVFRGVVGGKIHNCRFAGIGQTVINCAHFGFGGSDIIPDGTRQCDRIDISCNYLDTNFGSVAIVTKYVGATNISVNDNILINSCTIGISLESEHGLGVAEYLDCATICRNLVRGCSWAFITGGNVAFGISISEQARRVICNDNIVADIVANTLAVGILLGSSSTQSDTEIDRVALCDNNVSNITCLSGRSHGIMYETGDVDLDVLTIHGNIVDGADVGLAFSTASASKTLGTIKNLSVIGNKFRNCAEVGIWTLNVSGAGDVPIQYATFVANDVVGSGSHGMVLFLKNATLSANAISGAGGSGLVVLAGSTDCLFAGNRLVANDENGILATGDRLSFVDNRCNDNGQGGDTAYGLYIVDGVGNEVVGNRCGDTQDSPTQDYGIRAPNGTVMNGNFTIGNSIAPYFNGGIFAAWVTMRNRFASTPVTADNAEHTILTETVPQNTMAAAGMGLRVTVGYFGTWANNSVIVRLRLSTNPTALSTVTLGPSAFAREGTIIWELGQTGSGGARCGMTYDELLNGMTTTRADPSFDVAFDTSGADQDVTVTVQIVNSGDTASVGRWATEHLGW